MNVTELFNLTEWINSEISENQILKLYNALHSILQQNTQPSQAKQPFDEQKNVLVEALQKAPLNRLTLAQVNFLHKLGIAPYIGSEGISHLEEILVKNPIDPATAASNVQAIITSMTQGVEKSTVIKNGLEGTVDSKELPADEVLIRVSFANDAVIANIADFKEWGSKWHTIGRGIAIIHDISPEDIRIIGASNGSILLDLGVTHLIASTVSRIINKALDIAERIIEIRGEAEKVRTMRLSNDKIATSLEAEAKKVNDEGVEKLASEILSQLNEGKALDGNKQNAFNKAVGHLINFLSKGGEVDCVLPEDSETTQEDEGGTQDGSTRIQIAALRESFQQIRDHSAKLRVLEHTPQDDEVENS